MSRKENPFHVPPLPDHEPGASLEDMRRAEREVFKGNLREVFRTSRELSKKEHEEWVKMFDYIFVHGYDRAVENCRAILKHRRDKR